MKAADLIWKIFLMCSFVALLLTMPRKDFVDLVFIVGMLWLSIGMGGAITILEEIREQLKRIEGHQTSESRTP